MTRWVSVFFDPARGGYHARWRDHVSDFKRKVPRQVLLVRGADPSIESERGARLAYQWAVKQQEEVFRPPAPPESTLGVIWKMFEQANPNNIAPQTMEKYSQRIRPLIEFFDDEMMTAPDEIDSTATAGFVRWRMQSSPASQTVRGELTLLRQLLGWGMEWKEQTGMRGIRLIKFPRIAPTEPRRVALSTPQLGRILAARGHGYSRELVTRAKRIVVAGVTTMLRDTPLRRLSWAWIDGKRRWLDVPAQVMKMKRPLSVPLSLWTLRAIGSEGSGYVFPNPVNGGPTKWVYGIFAALAREAEVPRFTPHDLRRTGYTLLAEHGVERIVRKVLMGHETGIDVSDLYDRSFVERMRAAVEIFDVIAGTIDGNNLAARQ